MRTPRFRHLSVAAALALATLATAACSSGPARALPVQAPSTTPSTTPTATPDAAPASPSSRPTRPPPRPVTSPDQPCRGAVEYRINAADNGPATQRLCIAVGGVLRIDNLGPEGLTISPLDKVDCYYEGGVHVCRLVEPGTLRLTIDNGRQVRKITVNVTRGSSGTATACVGARGTHTIDANDGAMPWSAVCMRLGAELRVENLGPGLLTVTPSNAMSCRYEAAIHQCRIERTGTIQVVTNGLGGVRPLTVVAVR
jgi:hypothetical protein